MFRETLAGIGENDVSADLARIDAPTLLIWGDQDAFVPRSDQDTLSSAIRSARLRVYTGAGHAPGFHTRPVTGSSW